MLKFRFLIHCLAAAVLVFCIAQSSVAATVQQQLVKESTVEKVIQRGVLKVGMDTFLPWAM